MAEPWWLGNIKKRQMSVIQYVYKLVCGMRRVYMMKLDITWKNKNTEDFLANKKKIEREFTNRGLSCVKVNEHETTIVGNGNDKDYSKIWIAILHLNEHSFFYETIEKCIWFNNEPQEDVIEECKSLIQKGKLVIYD